MIAFLTKDLLFQSRVASIAKAESVALIADRTVDRVIARAADPSSISLWIIDLTLDFDDLVQVRESILEHSPTAKTIAYGPHVQAARLEQAHNAGFDHVLTRGQFDHQISQLIVSCSARR